MKKIVLFFILISCFTFAEGKKCFGIIPDKSSPHGFIPFRYKCGKEGAIYDVKTGYNVYGFR